MGLFSQKTGTPEQQQQQQDAANREADKKRKESIDKSKNQMKSQGDSIYAFGGKLASTIPSANGGMSANQFEAWLTDFENGFTQFTPDTQDTPYSMPFSQRPKARILSKGTNYQTQ